MEIKKRNLLILAGLLGAALMAGCTMAAGSSPAQAEPPTATIQAPTEVPASAAAMDSPTDMVPTEPPEQESESAEGATSAELPDQGPIPTGSSALHASDPTMVNLADGEPKLVEFFAFW